MQESYELNSRDNTGNTKNLYKKATDNFVPLAPDLWRIMKQIACIL